LSGFHTAMLSQTGDSYPTFLTRSRDVKGVRDAIGLPPLAVRKARATPGSAERRFSPCSG
jgi:hypothetical protein